MSSRNVSLLLIFIFIVIETTAFVESPAGRNIYQKSSMIYSDGKTYSTYCKSDRRCVCNEQSEGYCINCENEFHAKFEINFNRQGTITVSCNETIQAQQLKQDYFLEMNVSLVEKVELILTGCPAPELSYALLFGLTLENSEKVGKTSGVQSCDLKIDCGARKVFPIAKEHFDQFSRLQKLTLSCGALNELPGDLFRGQLRNLRYLVISKTLIERVPERIFYNLPNLETLVLDGNRIETLNKQHLHNLCSLKVLEINENRLSSLEAEVFQFTTNLEHLEIIGSKIVNIFNSISRLVNLKELIMSGNSIMSIERRNCVGLTNIEIFSMANNRIHFISPECFASFSKVDYIDLSGNSLSSLPDEAILMDNLISFYFNDNSVTILRVRQFIVSSRLRYLYMSNSSIESFDPDFLHRLPNLKFIDLSRNRLSSLHEHFFAYNPALSKINLRQNRLSSLSANIFSRNPELRNLYISSNNISSLPPSIFTHLSTLEVLDLSYNNLEVLSKSLLSNIHFLIHLDVSNNNIHTIEDDSFKDVDTLYSLSLGHNMLKSVSLNIFSPFKDFESLFRLDLQSNFLSSLPRLDIPSLNELNLANNSLKGIENDSFIYLDSIKRLNLSRNNIATLPDSRMFTYKQEILTLDLSFNNLRDIPEKTFHRVKYLDKIDLSGNKIKKLYLERICRYTRSRELDLSNNGLFLIERYEIDYFGSYIDGCATLKILNLSNNDISFNYSSWLFDEFRKTWGRVSPLAVLEQVEELYLANNSITEIFMDWRNMMPHLRVLDLRYNKFKYLTHQDLLYSSSFVHENGTAESYNCKHSLSVDLRHNLIRGVEVPESMLIKNISANHDKCTYSHATIFMDDNPFSCGCEMLKFLRLLYEDVILTSELWRTERKNWVLPARIDVGNLSCSEPETVRGKLLAEPETWMHHLLPMFGICSLLP